MKCVKLKNQLNKLKPRAKILIIAGSDSSVALVFKLI